MSSFLEVIGEEKTGALYQKLGEILTHDLAVGMSVEEAAALGRDLTDKWSNEKALDGGADGVEKALVECCADDAIKAEYANWLASKN